MANLSILGGAEFYHYDVEVYNDTLKGKIAFKPSQTKNITSKGYKIVNNEFYGATRYELINKFVKYLKAFDIDVDSSSFLLNDVIDKRADKSKVYTYDPHILTSSPKQYDAQAQGVNKNISAQNASKKSKQILEVEAEFKDNMHITKLDLAKLGIGEGTKTLYAFTKGQLKDKVESYLKGYKKDFDVTFIQKPHTIEVGKVLIDVTLEKDRAIGEVDLSQVNLPNIRVEGNSKQDLLDKVISELKTRNLTGKLNWGKITDNTKKVENKGGNSMKTMTKAAVKSFANKLSKTIKDIGMNQDEIEARVMAMIPNATPTDPSLSGNKVDLAFILPWNVADSLTKTDIKNIAKEKETLVKYLDILDATPWLYISDEIGDGIRVEVSLDVHFNNEFHDEEDYCSLELTTIDIPIAIEEEGEENEDALPKDIATYLEKQSFSKDEDEMYNRNLICYSLSFSKVSSMHIQALITVKDKYLNDWDFPVIEKLFKPLMDKYKGDLWSDGIELELPIDIKAVQEVIKKVSNEDEYIRDITKKGNQHIVLYGQDTSQDKKVEAPKKGIAKVVEEPKNKTQTQVVGGQQVSMPVLDDTKKPLPTTTMDSIALRDEFIKQVLHRMDCRLLNMTEIEFKKDVKAFHQVALNNIKHLKDVNLDFPNQKICIATITVKDTEDREIVNANMIEEHKIKFNGKLGTIRMKVNKDNINSIVDVVALIKEIRNADIKLGVDKNKDITTPNTGVEDMSAIKPPQDKTKKKVEKPKKEVVEEVPKKEEPQAQAQEPQRKSEVTYKKQYVKDPAHIEQLERMKAYVKKIAKVVDEDNDFNLVFLEEPKEFQKYKLTTVGVALFYYGDKSIAELKQNALYKKIYRGRGLSILRHFFKTTDNNGEPCIAALFIDNQYAKEVKAKLIKEALENNTQISINGKLYNIKAINEKQVTVESSVGYFYIDIDSELIDII